MIFGILDAQDTLGDAPGARNLDKVKGEVRFDNVALSYQNGHAILRRIDLHVKPGETVAIVGPSGSGKTRMMTRSTTSSPTAAPTRTAKT